MNPINNAFVRYSKQFTYISMEMFHNTMFHFIETVKVRSMARNISTGDYSGYFSRNVIQQPLISGVVSGFLGAGIGGLAFISSH